MKTALYVVGGGVGLYLVWKYILKSPGGPLTVTVARERAPNPSIAASSMTAAAAQATSVFGVFATPGLGPRGNGSVSGIPNMKELRAQAARDAMAIVARADAADPTAAPSPNGFSTTVIGTPGIEGSLSTGDGVDQRLLHDRNSVGGIYN